LSKTVACNTVRNQPPSRKNYCMSTSRWERCHTVKPMHERLLKTPENYVTASIFFCRMFGWF